MPRLSVPTVMIGLGLLTNMAHAQTTTNGAADATGQPILPWQQSAQQGNLFDASQPVALRGGSNAASNAGNRAGTGSVADGQTSGNIVYPTRPVRPVQRMQPMQEGVRSAPQLETYDPEGVKFGSFRLFPSLSLFGEVTDNIDNSQNGQEGQTGRIEAEASLQSEWARHRLQIDGRGTVSAYNEPDRKAEHDLSLDGELRLDLAERTSLTLRSGLSLQREEANNVELVASGGTRSVQTSLSGSAQFDHEVALVRLQLRGAINDENYDEDASRDYQNFTLGGRVGYRYTDQVTPFIDVEVSRRQFDNGPNIQDGDSLRASIGIAVEDREKLSGEVSVGYMVWQPEQSGQENDAGLYADASLVWSPNALWTIEAGATSSISSTSTGASSVSTHGLSLEADYAIRRNLTFSAAADLSRERYNGIGRTDWVSSGSLSAEYDVNRHMQLIARYSREARDSTDSSSDYTSNSFELGLRLQK